VPLCCSFCGCVGVAIAWCCLQGTTDTSECLFFSLRLRSQVQPRFDRNNHIPIWVERRCYSYLQIAGLVLVYSDGQALGSSKLQKLGKFRHVHALSRQDAIQDTEGPQNMGVLRRRYSACWYYACLLCCCYGNGWQLWPAGEQHETAAICAACLSLGTSARVSSTLLRHTDEPWHV
jgi:hypothetical protein